MRTWLFFIPPTLYDRLKAAGVDMTHFRKVTLIPITAAHASPAAALPTAPAAYRPHEPPAKP